MAELDALEPSEVLDLLFAYVIRRHRLLGLAGGGGKLVTIFDDMRSRKMILELGLSPTIFNLNAGPI